MKKLEPRSAQGWTLSINAANGIPTRTNLRRRSINTVPSPCALLLHGSLYLDHRLDRCKQRVYLEEEDIELTFIGYKYNLSRLYLYYLLCVLSGGIVFLLGRWMPQRYIAFVAQKCEMSKAECIVVQVCQISDHCWPQ